MPDDTRHVMLEQGLHLETPDGDVYTIAWDQFLHRMILILEKAAKPKKYTTGLAITPRSTNAIEIKPRRRDE